MNFVTTIAPFKDAKEELLFGFHKLNFGFFADKSIFSLFVKYSGIRAWGLIRIFPYKDKIHRILSLFREIRIRGKQYSRIFYAMSMKAVAL